MPRGKIGVLASGSGSNFQAIAEAAARGDVPGDVVLLLTNKADAFALERAAKLGVPAAFVDPQGLTREAHERELARRLDEAGVDVVCLAGYMRLLTPWFCEHYAGRLLNVHPALLPAFKGLDTGRQALESGVRVTGVTTHYVTPDMDAGPVILQSAVPVLPDDDEASLMARIHAEEHRLYPLTVKLHLDGRLVVRDGRCVVKDARVDAEQRVRWEPE